MAAVLRRDGLMVNRKRMRRLMRLMGIEAIYQKPYTGRRHPEHKVYPYLLRGMAIERPNQVWCADITYIPMAKENRRPQNKDGDNNALSRGFIAVRF
jgi:putative transposase